MGCLFGAMARDRVELRLGHSAEALFVAGPAAAPQAVLGVGVRRARDGALVRIGVRRAVVLATGGFSANTRLLRELLPGPVVGTGACPHARGDALVLGRKLGLQMAALDQAWGCEAVLEERLAAREWARAALLLQMRGDGFFVVDALGRRVYNEKAGYDKRVRVHWRQPATCRFLVMVGDRTCAEVYGSNFSSQWPADLASPVYVHGQSVAALAEALRQRFAQLADRTGGDVPPDYLAPEFAQGLDATFARFNEFARRGVDDDFARGDMPSERGWTVPLVRHRGPNPTMRELDLRRGLVAVIIAAAVLDTKGGPRTDTHQRAVGADGRTLEGLYLVGNCAEPISGSDYWSGGATLGSAMVSGYTAGHHATLFTRNIGATTLSPRL
jgi:succinate dehydrogenase/fumarate reductase flavoprotein subunit